MIYTAHDYLIWDDHSVYPSAFMPPDMPYKERYRRTRNKVMTYIRIFTTCHLIFVNDASVRWEPVRWEPVRWERFDENGFVPGFVPGRPPAISIPNEII